VTHPTHAPIPADRVDVATSADRLDVAGLPAGEVVRLSVALADDALGAPVRVPLLACRGWREGPVFGITAALHGDEVNGVAAVHELFRRLDPRDVRGAVVAVVVANPPGFLAGRRFWPDGTDLNHVMPGRADGEAAEVYAHRLVDRVVRHFDRLVDLHTARDGCANTLYVRADMSRPDVRRMAELVRPRIILGHRPSDHTLRGVAAALGAPAITVEIGDPHVVQPALVRAAATGLRANLREAGVLAGPAPAPKGPPPVVCGRSYWLTTDLGGWLTVLPGLGAAVRAGDTVARLSDIYGDPVRAFAAPEDGVVIGRSVSPVARAGARILHLGVVEP